jgi:hypothetical protein
MIFDLYINYIILMIDNMAVKSDYTRQIESQIIAVMPDIPKYKKQFAIGTQNHVTTMQYEQT